MTQKSFDQINKIYKLSPAEISDFSRARQRLADLIALQPVWIPLTQEEFLKLSIRISESQLKELGDYAKDPANFHDRPLLSRSSRRG